MDGGGGGETVSRGDAECEDMRTRVGLGQPLGTHWAGWTRAQSALLFLGRSLSLNPSSFNILLKCEFLLV